MENEIKTEELRVIIIAFVKQGWVKCCFTDRFGALHYFNEQTPLVTNKYLDKSIQFPQEGYLSCATIRINSQIVKIDIISPLGQRDQNGESVFEVYSSQLK